jgi:hypothetical protein
MMEDPEIIRLNIRHYKELLKVDSMQYTHDRVRKLLAKAEAELPAALAEAAKRKQ